MTARKAAGRRRVREPERTRRRLLEAATEEFSRKGLKGARVTAIARRARANAQAIYHHFGNKDALYTAVLESIYLSDWFVRIAEMEALEPVEAIRFLVAMRFDS